ncbi:hypothetical protein OB236_22370 [Paenibacillus sp. WQ 127069]|uniref:TnsA endonuclease N-terminal domain-containing protein n=1 Tax=Paenibacillus baimaensis TaxID=2982185 RepID=A0ABT2ULX5_9BACL|nr:hypothetical protein [Paenibacillus sp. WQ 127069]MCU6794862.1 hypothetical protein [Paenibacillus sp. WQ 127069]
MDWRTKSWIEEDVEFVPKRNVNNKGSRYFRHITGFLISQKMNRKKVGYESLWGECLFYYILEMDPLIVRYYEQPVEVPIRELNDACDLSEWMHVPDVLAFRHGYKPFLFQIKGGNQSEQKDYSYINSFCHEYAKSRGWNYSMAFPKTLEEAIQFNIRLLKKYDNLRFGSDRWIPEIRNKMKYIHETSILELARGFSAQADFRSILPCIYHLIFKGELQTNVRSRITEKSIIRAGSCSEQFLDLFHIEGDAYDITNASTR